MTELKEGSVRHGCLIFLIALLVLGAGAGISVLILGRSAKPKARALVLGKPKARLEEVAQKLTPDMPADVRANFLAVFQLYTDALQKYGSQRFETLGPLGDSMRNIEADKVITTEEATQWTEQAKKALGP